MNQDIKDTVCKHEKDIEKIKASFSTDSAGEPDYTQHLKDHNAQKQDRETRNEIFSNVSSWAVIGILTLMVSHFFQSIKTFISTLGR